MFGEVGDKFLDTGKRANGWPETPLSDVTLHSEFLFRERDIREEGEEVIG